MVTFGYCFHIVHHVQCISMLKIQVTDRRRKKKTVSNAFLWITLPYLHILPPKGPTRCSNGKISVNVILFNILPYWVFFPAISFRMILMGNHGNSPNFFLKEGVVKGQQHCIIQSHESHEMTPLHSTDPEHSPPHFLHLHK